MVTLQRIFTHCQVSSTNYIHSHIRIYFVRFNVTFLVAYFFFSFPAFFFKYNIIFSCCCSDCFRDLSIFVVKRFSNGMKKFHFHLGDFGDKTHILYLNPYYTVMVFFCISLIAVIVLIRTCRPCCPCRPCRSPEKRRVVSCTVSSARQKHDYMCLSPSIVALQL